MVGASHSTRACLNYKHCLIRESSPSSRMSVPSSHRLQKNRFYPAVQRFLRTFFRTPIRQYSGKRRYRGNNRPTGWGGRTADLLHSLNSNSKISLTISIAGTNMFEVGNTVIPYRISPTWNDPFN